MFGSFAFIQQEAYILPEETDMKHFLVAVAKFPTIQKHNRPQVTEQIWQCNLSVRFNISLKTLY